MGLDALGLGALGLQSPPPGGGGGGFSPALLPNLWAWWRSDMGVTDVAGKASVWGDQSGNGRDWLQTTASRRPAYNTAGALPHLELRKAAGANTFMSNNFTSPTFTDWFVIFIMDLISTPGGEFLSSLGGGAVTVYAHLAGGMYAYWPFSAAGPATTTGLQSHSWDGQSVAGTLEARLNGGAPVSRSYNGTRSIKAQTALNAYYTTAGGGQNDANIYEAIFCAANGGAPAISPADLALVNAYATARYGV